MYNYIMLIGRIANDIELKATETKKSVINLVLAVSRPFKNQEGLYETDFIRVTLWEQVAEITSEYCKKGSMVAVKGRVGTRKETLESGVIINVNEIIGDKIVFLNSKDSYNLE